MGRGIFFALPLSLFCLVTGAQESKGVDLLDDQKILDEFYRTALTGSSVYPWLEDLCLKIGHRLSGSPQADQAVEYAFSLMDSLGIHPRKQPVMVPHWVRGEQEMAYYTTAGGQKGVLNICALGGSIATPEEGIMAPVVEVGDWQELEALGREKIEGKIVFFNEHMPAENIYTFESYGHCVKHRWAGAVEAARYGAVGAVVRSLSLRIDDYPHTGSMKYEEGITPIPGAAISTRAAEELSALLEAGDTVEVFMKQSCQTLPDKQSYNVLGEIRGSEFPGEVILVGGHLDSWDVGHGAHDDGAGVMQSLAVLELFKLVGYTPRHTIRVVFFMNEENGLRGAQKYAEEAALSGEKHLAAIESDRGGFTPRGFHVEGDPEAIERITKWKPLLEKYGVHQLQEGGSGADIKPLADKAGVLIGFVPDSQRYFDHHHSAADTFDTVNKRELELGTASIASLVYLLDKYGL